MSKVADKMAEAGSGRPLTKGTDQEKATPKKGERFRCQNCGMEVMVTAECGCKDANHVHFHCCGQELQKV